MENLEFDEKLLPVTISFRVVKEQLPEGIIVTKQVKKMMNLAASVFICYVGAIAGEIAKDSKGRKKKAIVSTVHILKALEEINYESISSIISSSFPIYCD
jgi:hypothetical protein